MDALLDASEPACETIDSPPSLRAGEDKLPEGDPLYPTGEEEGDPDGEPGEDDPVLDRLGDPGDDPDSGELGRCMVRSRLACLLSLFN